MPSPLHSSGSHTTKKSTTPKLKVLRVLKSGLSHLFSLFICLEHVIHFVCIQAGLSMPRNTLSQSQAKITSTHLDAPQSNTEHGNETVSEDDTDSESDTDDTKVTSLQAAKRLPAHLQQIKEAPMDQHKKRHSRRLLGKEDKTSDTPPLSHRSSYGQSPHKKGLNRRDGHGKRKEEQLLNRQVTDSQLLQATHDDPNGRKKREKPLDR